MPQLQAVRKNARFTAGVVADDLRDLARGRLRPAPVNLSAQQQEILERVRRDGYAVVPDYWTRERAFEVRDEILPHVEDANRDLDNGAYLRSRAGSKHDAGVRRIYQIEKLIPELAEVRHDPFVLDIATAYYRRPQYSGVLMFQHNHPSNETRGFHVDAWSREFKSFVYLDDVDVENGPFTYIRGSHRNHGTRLRRQVFGEGNGVPSTGFSEEEVGRLIDREDLLLGNAGTLILTDVRGLHRGAPQKSGRRSVLVNYILKHPGDLDIDR